MKSSVRFINGNPMIDIDRCAYSPLAYTTYFDECGQWSDFIRNGYRMFFVNVSFTDLPINNTTGFSPFITGVFEKEEPDYWEFDRIAESILNECKDAFIFPRINISMPRRWLIENPYETVDTPTGKRESLYSDAFRKDASELLEKLVSHIRSASYSDRIAGYQICGGTTQEWFHHDLYGSFSEMGMKKFRQWVCEKYGAENEEDIQREDLEKGTVTDKIKKYYQFCNEMAADTAEYFAKNLKRFINNEQVVGVFYGYNAFVSNPLWGTHGLGRIINSPYIDFFSSPCAYDASRQPGVDWGDMIPVDSVKLHGKLCFIECDIRTCLTEKMQSSRPGRYPDGIYALEDEKGNKTVWSGPDSEEESIFAIRKAFSHQLVKKSGIWWFDMWGGWYHSERIMNEIRALRLIYENFCAKSRENMPSSEVVLFVDEKAYWNIPRGNSAADTVSSLRVAMGNTGIPFDLYMTEDAQEILPKYKFAIFSAPYPSESGKKAKELCEKMNIPYISSEAEKPFYSTSELRKTLVSSGVHCYNEKGSVVYCSDGFVGIHTLFDGETEIKLPKKYKVRSLSDSVNFDSYTDRITFMGKKHGMEIFELT